MAIEALGGVNTAQAPNLAQAVVSQQDFLRILLTQLNFQDPLKPVDNEQFIAQLAQFTNLEQTRELTDNVSTLLTIQASTQSIGLLGKTVDVASASGAVTGTVTTIQFTSGQPTLTVLATDGTILNAVGLSQITLVRNQAVRRKHARSIYVGQTGPTGFSNGLRNIKATTSPTSTRRVSGTDLQFQDLFYRSRRGQHKGNQSSLIAGSGLIIGARRFSSNRASCGRPAAT
jgi:flagellar basal-body rod modification protein FlgD